MIHFFSLNKDGYIFIDMDSKGVEENSDRISKALTRYSPVDLSDGQLKIKIRENTKITRIDLSIPWLQDCPNTHKVVVDSLSTSLELALLCYTQRDLNLQNTTNLICWVYSELLKLTNSKSNETKHFSR